MSSLRAQIGRDLKCFDGVGDPPPYAHPSGIVDLAVSFDARHRFQQRSLPLLFDENRCRAVYVDLRDHEFLFLMSFPCPAFRCPDSVAASMKYPTTNSLIE